MFNWFYGPQIGINCFKVTDLHLQEDIIKKSGTKLKYLGPPSSWKTMI